MLRCLDFSAASPSTSGRHSLFRSAFSVKRPLPLRFIASPRVEVTSRRSALLPSLARGRGTYCVSAFPVNRLRRPLLSTDSALSPLRLSPCRGAAFLPPPRWVSTPLVDFVFRLSNLLGSSHRRCDFAVPFRGRGFYHRRVRSQPTSSTLSSRRFGSVASATFAVSRGCGFYHHRVESQLRLADSVFRLSARPEDPAASAASLFRPRGRGFYHHRVGSQPTSSLPSSRSRWIVMPSSVSSGRGYWIQPEVADPSFHPRPGAPSSSPIQPSLLGSGQPFGGFNPQAMNGRASPIAGGQSLRPPRPERRPESRCGRSPPRHAAGPEAPPPSARATPRAGRLPPVPPPPPGRPGPPRCPR